jgi:hypothetical protein
MNIEKFFKLYVITMTIIIPVTVFLIMALRKLELIGIFWAKVGAFLLAVDAVLGIMLFSICLIALNRWF